MESEVSEPDPKDDGWEEEDTAVSGAPPSDPPTEPASPADTDEPDTLVGGVDDTWEGPAELPTTNDEDGAATEVPDEVEGEEEFEPPTLVDEP